MDYDVIPELPKISDNEIFEYDEEFVLNEFKKGRNKFVFYDTDQNEPRFFYYRLDERLYSLLVFLLSQKTHEKVYNFLKLVLEGVRLIKQNNKVGYKNAVRIEKQIKNFF